MEHLGFCCRNLLLQHWVNMTWQFRLVSTVNTIIFGILGQPSKRDDSQPVQTPTHYGTPKQQRHCENSGRKRLLNSYRYPSNKKHNNFQCVKANNLAIPNSSHFITSSQPNKPFTQNPKPPDFVFAKWHLANCLRRVWCQVRPCHHHLHRNRLYLESLGPWDYQIGVKFPYPKRTWRFGQRI